MKLISLNQHLLKPIIYFGIVIEVPEDVLYVAADEDGEMYGYETEPYCRKTGDWECYDKSYFLGVADLEGMNWKETLRGV